MENGIITKDGKFISCDFWGHMTTSFRHDTSNQFILCRDRDYSKPTLDIVGKLNKQMLDALYDFATRNSIIIEDFAANDLEDAIESYLGA